MTWMMSESLEPRLGKTVDLLVTVGDVEGALVNVKLAKSPKLTFTTEDIKAGLNLLNTSPHKAIIKYSTFEYEFVVSPALATLTVERIGEKLRITLGVESEKKK
jgi:hypothetical protein